jgi:long-chain fatty acid transport protein
VNKSRVFRKAAIAALIAGPLTAAMATNGYFSHGYGMKAKGMGGASVAMAQDGFAGANNPAAASWAGDRFDVGLDLFAPSRGMERTGSGATPSINAAVNSDSNLFLVPEFGYNRVINDKLAMGLTVYGNGGMNTDYTGGQISCTGVNYPAGAKNVLCGTGTVGMDLIQLIIAPTASYKLNESNSVGISPLLVVQQFKAYGLDGFAGLSSAPTKLTSGNYEQSKGLGVRLGYFGKINDKVKIGASLSPQISMSKFDSYAGLFANAGQFDIPGNYTVGASFQATPNVVIALDYQRINYSGVPSVNNPLNSPGQLGTANGKGFGWTDINVIKLGVQWQTTPKMVLRAGLNIGENPVHGADVTFNIIAPGVTTQQVTFGGTYSLSPKSEVTFAMMYAPSNSVSGPSFWGAAGGTETIQMSQKSLGVQYSWKY